MSKPIITNLSSLEGAKQIDLLLPCGCVEIYQLNSVQEIRSRKIGYYCKRHKEAET